jgi:hypothetical protein
VAFQKRTQQDEKMELKMELDFLLQKVDKMRELKQQKFKDLEKKTFSQINEEFDELFSDAKNVQDSLKRELSVLQSGIDPEHILDDYLSENDEDDKDFDDFLENRQEKKDYSVRVSFFARVS